jgi:hypothetical protein
MKMALFLVTLVLMLIIVAGMAVGVLAGRSPIKGSCGGMSALGIDTECDICGGDPNKCKTSEPPRKSSRLPYDAMGEK